MSLLTPQTALAEVIDFVRSAPPGSAPAGWHQWENVKAAHRRLADDFLAVLNVPSEAGSGRGIVTAGGGVKLFPSLWVFIHAVREVGCRLPVQVWYLGDVEMDPGMKSLLEPLGVTFVDARKLARHFPCRILHGWELKMYAILHASFREVFFIDADAAPLRDPTFLFEEAAYRDTGAIFWPDYPTWDLREEVWQTFGIPLPPHSIPPVEAARVHEYYSRPIVGPHEASIESGQVVVDKGRRWRELRLALWYCEHSDFYFQHIHGDKETLHLAWRKLGSPYGLPDIWPDWHTHTIVQFGFDHQPLIAHRTWDKWRLAGDNKRSGTAPGEDRGFRLLEQLRRRWGGVPWRNDYPTATEVLLRAALAGTQWLYRRVGHDERPLELLAASRVGEGATDRERWWSLFLDDGEALLALCGDDTPTCILRCYPDHVWRGYWLQLEQMPVELVPRKGRQLRTNDPQQLLQPTRYKGVP